MARSHGIIYTSIWDPENDFRRLPFAAQWAYTMLLTQPEISPVGVMKLDWKNWAANAADIDQDELRDLLELLAAHEYIVLDHDTDELWIRTFMFHDKIFKQPQVAIAAARSVGSVRSLTLRRLISESVPPGIRTYWPHELKGMKRPEAKALLDGCNASDWKPSVTPNRTPNDSPDLGLTEGLTEPLTEPLALGSGVGVGDGVGTYTSSQDKFSKGSLLGKTLVGNEPSAEREAFESHLRAVGGDLR